MRHRKTDLGFLVDLKWNAKNAKWLKTARQIVRAVKKYHKTKSQTEVAEILKMQPQYLIQRLTELRKVAKAGMTLEEYAESDRQFAIGNHVIASRSTKKKGK